MPREAALRSEPKQRGRPFQKGKSGNPGGRPKKTPELVEVENLCKQLSPRAVERLAEWMEDDNPRASVAAAQSILERAFGKPRQPIEHAGEIDHKVIPVKQLEPEDRAKLRAFLEQHVTDVEDLNEEAEDGESAEVEE